MFNQHLKREMPEEEFKRRQKLLDQIEAATGLKDDGFCGLETVSLATLVCFIRVARRSAEGDQK